MNPPVKTDEEYIEGVLTRLQERVGGTREEIVAFLDAWPMNPDKATSYLFNESELYNALLNGETIDWSRRDPNWRMP